MQKMVCRAKGKQGLVSPGFYSSLSLQQAYIQGHNPLPACISPGCIPFQAYMVDMKKTIGATRLSTPFFKSGLVYVQKSTSYINLAAETTPAIDLPADIRLPYARVIHLSLHNHLQYLYEFKVLKGLVGGRMVKPSKPNLQLVYKDIGVHHKHLGLNMSAATGTMFKRGTYGLKISYPTSQPKGTTLRAKQLGIMQHIAYTLRILQPETRAGRKQHFTKIYRSTLNKLYGSNFTKKKNY